MFFNFGDGVSKGKWYKKANGMKYGAWCISLFHEVFVHLNTGNDIGAKFVYIILFGDESIEIGCKIIGVIMCV